MAFKPDLDTLILAALENGELHGYAIAREIEKATDGNLGVPEGRLYPALHRLSEDGQVDSRWLHQDGKPSRRIYRLTDEGTKILAKKKSAWKQFSSSINQLLNPQEGR